MITPTQKQTIQGIVNIFETGSVTGDYGSVVVIPGDTGHLTFGRSQTTLASGNLGKLLHQYCDNPAAKFAGKLAPFLPRFDAIDLTLDNEQYLQNVLRATADDHIMRETQDAFFDAVYWGAATRAADAVGITTPLGVGVVYDSTIHGSWAKMRDTTTASAGAFATIGEQAWVTAYVATRRNWLATSPRKDLNATVYRMDAFTRLIALGEWGLELPLVVRSSEISLLTLNATPKGCYDGPVPGSRSVAVQTPLLTGLDVRLLQLGLSASEPGIKADGVFGRGSATVLQAYQTAHGLPATGVADAATFAALAV